MSFALWIGQTRLRREIDEVSDKISSRGQDAPPRVEQFQGSSPCPRNHAPDDVLSLFVVQFLSACLSRAASPTVLQWEKGKQGVRPPQSGRHCVAIAGVWNASASRGCEYYTRMGGPFYRSCEQFSFCVYGR